MFVYYCFAGDYCVCWFGLLVVVFWLLVYFIWRVTGVCVILCMLILYWCLLTFVLDLLRLSCWFWVFDCLAIRLIGVICLLFVHVWLCLWDWFVGLFTCLLYRYLAVVLLLFCCFWVYSLYLIWWLFGGALLVCWFWFVVGWNLFFFRFCWLFGCGIGCLLVVVFGCVWLIVLLLLWFVFYVIWSFVGLDVVIVWFYVCFVFCFDVVCCWWWLLLLGVTWFNVILSTLLGLDLWLVWVCGVSLGCADLCALLLVLFFVVWLVDFGLLVCGWLLLVCCGCLFC